MNLKKVISILFPPGEDITYHVMTDTACHDIGLDTICEKLSPKPNEQRMILSIMRMMTDDREVSDFRIGVFSDILSYPGMRERMLKLLDQIRFLNDYGSFKKEHEVRSGMWDFLHRLSELNDYIKSVEAIRECLNEYDIRSEGLRNLKEYMNAVYEASSFAELKHDIESLNATTSTLKSITLGINLNQSFEVESIGLISVNNKEFKGSGILSHFTEAITAKNGIHDGNEWNGSFRFHPISEKSAELSQKSMRFGESFAMVQQSLTRPVLAPKTIANVPEQDSSAYLTHYFDQEVSHLLSHLTKKLEQILSKYVSLSIGDIVDLIPEFSYYVRWAEYIEALKEKGLYFCTPEVLSPTKAAQEKETTKDNMPDSASLKNTEKMRMKAHNIYNLKLATATKITAEEIVPNDLDFSDEHTVYLLTGANRGGKTTITQAIGLLFALAQGGISVPGESFSFSPVDCIYTHYPADEDKTLDLGRLGEECKRFKDLFNSCTKNSLLLMNETFSTTSFEEGYFIAKDAVKAILQKEIRTIYNTHMHKLAYEIEEFNKLSPKSKAVSLVARSEDGKRSFQMKIAAPEGRSYAEDIALKYGVTYEALLKDSDISK